MSFARETVDTEIGYSPSLHTKRFQNYKHPNTEVLRHFVKVSKEGSPIFVYIHGGFWQELDKTTSGPIVHTLIDNYRVILVDYDICPKVTLQELTQQLTNFYKWLSVYAKQTQTPRISVCGHSAGAHLALQLFQNIQDYQQLHLIDNLFLISGLYDLRQLWSFQSCNPNNILALNDKLAFELSPITWTYNKDLIRQSLNQRLKVHIIVAENDSEAFKKQSQNYAYTLMQLNMNINFRMFSFYDHFDIIEDCSNRDSVVSCYIRNELNI
ncbi:kynurenine formamidase isoform X2 [Haematobia irritans]|uniref:kynurenine formamidase isoform X2 n=1 Tax=Haematobia irritans TaxID=7368 RepID=UPI003F4F98D9